jgi:glycosyltransferase involved in cell wall biosynthesis
MRRLLIVTAAELTQDPRARRQALFAHLLGWEAFGVSGTAGSEPTELDLEGIIRVPTGRVSAALQRTSLANGSPRSLVRELRGLYRLLRLAGTTIRLARAGRRFDGVDVVHANDLDTLAASWLIARRARARLVYDAHELYSEFEPAPPRIYRACTSWAERVLARRADAVVTVSDPIADELVRRLRLGRRPLVVLNCPSLAEVPPPELPEVESMPLRAVYQGTLGPGRELADLLAIVAAAPEVRFTLRIPGVDQEELFVAAAGLPNVSIAAPVAPDDVIRAIEGEQVGLIFDQPVTRNGELSLPNKLFEYLAAGLAVVVSDLEVLGQFAEREDVGLAVAGGPEGIAAALMDLARDPARLASFRRKAAAASRDRFNAEAQSLALRAAWAASE